MAIDTAHERGIISNGKKKESWMKGARLKSLAAQDTAIGGYGI